MGTYCHHIVILLVAASSFVDVIKAEKAVSRNGKVFSLFSIVTFPNAGCASQSSMGIQKHVMEPVLPLQNVLRKEEQLVGTVLQDLEYAVYSSPLLQEAVSIRIAHTFKILISQMPMHQQLLFLIQLINVHQTYAHSG